MEFIGNGVTTENIALNFKQLCDELEKLGNLEQSYWALHLRGNKQMLKSRAKQIVMRAKMLEESINCYTKS